MNTATHFDAIVIGAGNGGLSAACRLAQAGKRVLLMEQHNLPGGCASSFRRGRFEFEVALHELSGKNQPDSRGGLNKRLLELGMEVPFCVIPDVFRLIATGRDGEKIDVRMPSGVDAYIEEMERLVPGSRESMQTFFRLFKECEKALNAIMMGKIRSQEDLEAAFPDYAAVVGKSTDQVLEEIGMPQRAQDILNTYWSYLGVDTTRCSFDYYSECAACYVAYGASIPRYNSHGMNTAFLEAFRKQGGEVWFNTRAEKILLDGGRVCGVAYDGGEVYAGHVVANLNPHALYKLLPDEAVPERQKKLANARRLNFRPFVVWMGLDKTAAELGIEDYAIFISETADTKKSYEDMKVLDCSPYYVAICYNTVNPGFSPEGTCVLSFTAMYSDDAWKDVSQEDYLNKKYELADKLIADYESRLGISIRDSIEEIDIASPWTLARYVGVPNGCIYGYEADEWDGVLPRMLDYAKANPIPGLRFCGASDFMGDGYGPANLSGDVAARMTLRDMQKEAAK